MRKNEPRQYILWCAAENAPMYMMGRNNRRIVYNLQNEGKLLIDGDGFNRRARLTEAGWLELAERLGERDFKRIFPLRQSTPA